MEIIIQVKNVLPFTSSLFEFENTIHVVNVENNPPPLADSQFDFEITMHVVNKVHNPIPWADSLFKIENIPCLGKKKSEQSPTIILFIIWVWKYHANDLLTMSKSFYTKMKYLNKCVMF